MLKNCLAMLLRLTRAFAASFAPLTRPNRPLSRFLLSQKHVPITAISQMPIPIGKMSLRSILPIVLATIRRSFSESVDTTRLTSPKPAVASVGWQASLPPPFASRRLRIAASTLCEIGLQDHEIILLKGESKA